MAPGGVRRGEEDFGVGVGNGEVVGSGDEDLGVLRTGDGDL